MIDQQFIATLLNAAADAGRAIMEVYGTRFAVEIKDDKSPLTAADRASHLVIKTALSTAFPDVPILSEEGRQMSYELRKGWASFFLVDPLDGTKEFIKRNGQFTVNIALMEGQAPVYGVIGVPAGGTLYYGGPGRGAFRQLAGQAPQAIRARRPAPSEGHTVLASLSHGNTELEDYLDTIQVKQRKNMGSALKFCAVAEGDADLYPRTGPTMEWDTAAGHAILLGAGGSLTRFDGGPFVYNKPELLNPPFIARGWVE